MELTYNRVCPRFRALSYEHYYSGRNRGAYMMDTLDEAYTRSLREETIEITKKGDHKKRKENRENFTRIFQDGDFP